MASPSSWRCLRRNQRSQNSILFILAFQSCSASSQELHQYLWYNGQYHSGRYFWSRGCLSKYKDSCELQSQVDACSWTAHHRIAADEDFWQTYHWNWTDGQMHFLQIRLGKAPRSPSQGWWSACRPQSILNWSSQSSRPAMSLRVCSTPLSEKNRLKCIWCPKGPKMSAGLVKGSIRDGQRQRWLNALSRPLPGAASFSRHNPHPPLSLWLYMSYLAHRAMLQWRVVDFRSINDTVISSFMYIRIAGLPLPLESLARRIRVRGYLTLVHFFYRESWPLRVQGFEVEPSRRRAVSCLQILYPVKIFVPSFQDDAPTETGY